MLTERDLTDLEIADSIGDFGRNSRVGDAVEELRELRKRVAAIEGELRVRDDQLDAARQRILAYDEQFLVGTRPAGSLEAARGANASSVDSGPFAVGGGRGGNSGGAVVQPDPLSAEERGRRMRLAWWADLSDEHRLALIGQCCTGCGSLNPSCRCGDDS